MYKTVAIGPVFLTHHLSVKKINSCKASNFILFSLRSQSFAKDSKLILITTEGGSITLRTKEEGGGNYGHHGSKAAANMVGKLLAFDLIDHGITVAMIHVRLITFLFPCS